MSSADDVNWLVHLLILPTINPMVGAGGHGGDRGNVRFFRRVLDCDLAGFSYEDPSSVRNFV